MNMKLIFLLNKDAWKEDWSNDAEIQLCIAGINYILQHIKT